MKHWTKGRVALLITTMLFAGTIVVGLPAAAGSLSGTLYVNPNTTAAQWVASNSSDYRAPVIQSNISSKSIAKWIAAYNPSGVQAEVSSYVSAANAAGAVPQLVPYMIPNRDCGGPSAGGAPTWSDYQAWVTNFAAGLGNKMVIIVLEPDSLALMTCLGATEIQERYTNLNQAIQKIKAANPNAKIYLDAGHSSWNSPAETASRLTSAGIANADGFYSNASNYRYSADEVAFGQQVQSALGSTTKRQIIDTSRNGNGPLGSEWCDPDGRKIGMNPTLSTGYAHVDGFIWIKVPGEADGCAAAAGVFVPDLAYDLAGGGTATTTQATTTTTQATTTTTQGTTTTTTQGTTTTTSAATTTTSGSGGISCSVYQLDQWGSGYVAYVRVTNNGSPVTSWSVPLTFNQSTTITNSWSVTLSGSGASRTASNTSGNGVLATGSSVEFGFQGTSTQTFSASCGGVTTTTQATTTTTQAATTTTTQAATTTTTQAATTTTTQAATTTTTQAATTTTTQAATTTTTQAGSGGLTCSVKTGSWSSGYQLDVTVTNGGTSAISGWTATLLFSQAPNLTGSWSAIITSSANTVTAKNLSWNGNLGPGGSAAFGLQGTHSGTFATPTCSAQ